jgi:hypothetical protein
MLLVVLSGIFIPHSSWKKTSRGASGDEKHACRYRASEKLTTTTKHETGGEEEGQKPGWSAAASHSTAPCSRILKEVSVSSSFFASIDPRRTAGRVKCTTMCPFISWWPHCSNIITASSTYLNWLSACRVCAGKYLYVCWCICSRASCQGCDIAGVR